MSCPWIGHAAKQNGQHIGSILQQHLLQFRPRLSTITIVITPKLYSDNLFFFLITWGFALNLKLVSDTVFRTSTARHDVGKRQITSLETDQGHQACLCFQEP